MLLTDKFNISGHLTIRVVDGKSGHIKQVVETPNLIVNGTKEILAAMLCHEYYDRYQLWGIGAGISTAAPAASQADLQGDAGKRYKKMYYVGGREYSSEGLVTMRMTMGVDEGNLLSAGDYYAEAGLFTRGDVDWAEFPPDTITNSKMLARQLHAPIHKDATISLEYTWRIQIAIS
jgi:hypothetical protein